MHKEQIIYAGNTINATKALIMVHGRGADAADILGLSQHLQVTSFLLSAPEATNHSWYPKSFLAPPAENEPWLSSALDLLGKSVTEVEKKGIKKEQIFFLGFSQGACLTLEFTARNATRYGGIVAFTGGLIGDKIYPEHYSGDFEGTPVFIGSSDADPHVPVTRVYASANILKALHADVTEKVYHNMGHTIIPDEIETVNTLIFKS